MFSFDDEREHVIWLEAGYSCAGCGCDYRYRFKVRTLADDQDEAIGRARRKVQRKGLRDIPCPECGRVTAPVHQSRHPAIATLMASFAGAIAFITLIVWKLHVLKLFAGAVAAGGSTLFATTYSLWLLFSRNAPSAKRRRDAQELIDLRVIRSIQPNAALPRTPPIGGVRELMPQLVFTWFGATILIVVGLGISSISDAYNPDVIPGYVAPGDEVEYTFPDKIKTVKGFWRGQPTFRARLLPDNSRPVRITGEGRMVKWPEEMIVKRSEEAVWVKPLVRFRVPFQQELEDKSIDLMIRMEVTYPESQGRADGGGLRYEVKENVFESSMPLHISPTEEVDRLKAAWWISAIVAVISLAVPPLILAIRSWQSRHATYVLDLHATTSPKSDPA